MTPQSHLPAWIFVSNRIFPDFNRPINSTVTKLILFVTFFLVVKLAGVKLLRHQTLLYDGNIFHDANERECCGKNPTVVKK